jgi:hypothetical protein
MELVKIRTNVLLLFFYLLHLPLVVTYLVFVLLFRLNVQLRYLLQIGFRCILKHYLCLLAF